jgi:Flp pilus assembly protein TadD
MKLPAGWGAELPEAVHERSPYAIYDETYRLEDGTIHSERRLQVLQQYVPVADAKTYTRFAEKADLGNESYIQLTHPAAAAGKSPTVSKAAEPTGKPEASSAGDAAALLQQAFPMMVDPSGDLNAAQALLDRTKALKPEQPGLWSAYGYLSFRRGDLAGSIVDYRKELALHPAGTQVYPALIQAQLTLHQQAEAKQTLGQWIAADPSASQPSLQLAALQIRDSHPQEALITLQHARVALPDDARIQLMLGKTEIESGDKEHGHQLLLALVKSTDDTGLMNDAAYELADAGFELPLAEATTRKALDQMEAQSLTWTLDENQQTLRRQTALLQATWDTMGWIYFREGKLDLADQYVRASWLGRQSGEVGLHLGQISAARGEKNKALSSFELARATYPGYDDLGVRTPPGRQEVDLQARADALKKAGARHSPGDPGQALQKLRTIPLGAAAGLNGTAEYRLLVSQDAVVRAEPTGARQLTGDQQRLKLARLTGFSPAGSHAQLVFTGMLNCHSNMCELVLEP